jgi:Protease inhibitor Inh
MSRKSRTTFSGLPAFMACRPENRAAQGHIISGPRANTIAALPLLASFRACLARLGGDNCEAGRANITGAGAKGFFRVRNFRGAHAWRGLVLVGGLLAGTGGRAAAPSPQVQDLAGVWDLSIEGTNTTCRIALRGQSSAGRRQITIPLACLRNFPGLAPVDGWALTGDGGIEFFDGTDQTVLDFTATDAKAFLASGPQGAVYRLAALQGAPQKKEPFVKQGGTSPAPEAIATKLDVPVATVSGAGGRYSILRDGGKDTGCMLTLDNQLKAPGGKKASLAPGCRDQGIVIFDPSGWQIVNGRLVLTARKGHKTELDQQPDGTWKKDPKEGKSLTLKKL